MEQQNEPAIIVGSRTQSAETIEQLLSNDYEGISVKTQSDVPDETAGADEAADKTNQDEGEEGSTDSSADPSDAGDAGEDEDETAGVDDAGAAATDVAEQQERKRKSGSAKAKEKFQRLTDEIEELKRKLAEKDGSSAKPADEPEIVIPEEMPDPDPDDFENGVYDAGYIKAVTKVQRHNERREELVAAQNERQEKAAKAKADQDAEEKAANESAWKEQVEIGKSRHEDFEQVLEKANSMPAETALSMAIQDSDMSGLLVYHLATHPNELAALNQKLKLPENATAGQFRKMMRIAHREIDRLEALVGQDSGGSDESTTDEQAANGSSADEAQPAPETTETTRESRPAAASKPTPATKPAAAAAPPKAKPTPVDRVGSRNGAVRPKRIQDMSREEIHRMQQKDPDGFRKLMEQSRA